MKHWASMVSTSHGAIGFMWLAFGAIVAVGAPVWMVMLGTGITHLVISYNLYIQGKDEGIIK